MKRLLDIVVVALLAPIAVPVALVIGALIRLTSPGPALYWSRRVGKDEQIFVMPKFRTMRIDTPAVATHLLEDPLGWLTPQGSFLRRTSLDEIPQLWCLLTGDMTLVGPRPALFNQIDLMALRRAEGVAAQVPGITGWAQVNGRDELSIPDKVRFEVEYRHHESLWLDLKILLLTARRMIRPTGVSH